MGGWMGDSIYKTFTFGRLTRPALLFSFSSAGVLSSTSLGVFFTFSFPPWRLLIGTQVEFYFSQC